MTNANQRVYLDELSKRWQKSADHLVEMAAKGNLNLWFEFTNVIVLRVKKKKAPGEPQLFETIEVRPQSEVLTQMLGRTDRLQVAAQYPCLNVKGKPVLISNAVGDEWGETSMIGLNPMRLYARLGELHQVERKKKIVPLAVEQAHSCCQSVQETTDDSELIPVDHPCYAPELHIALECWLELMADEEEPESITKAIILAWLHDHYPKLSKTACGRIALVVSPASKHNGLVKNSNEKSCS
jgi:hypothetical protein